MSEAEKPTPTTPVVVKAGRSIDLDWFGFWFGACLFIAAMNWWFVDANGMTAFDAIMQAINPAWTPEISSE